MGNNCRLKTNAFGRLILTHEHTDALAWTGSSWSEVNEYGVPIGRAQVCNFSTKTEATDYAIKAGLSLQEPSIKRR
jgi:hypothetical protein